MKNLDTLKEALRVQRIISKFIPLDQIAEHEETITKLEDKIRRQENEINNERELKKSLQNTISELETQRKKLFDTIEEWGNKSKKLKGLCEEEQQKRQEVEESLREQQEKYKELSRVLDDTRAEINDKNEQIKNLLKNIAELENNINAQKHQYKTLQREFEDAKLEFGSVDQQRTENMKSLKEQIDTLKAENKTLNDKILEIIKSEKERFDAEVTAHHETKNQLKSYENKLQAVGIEVDNYEQQIDKLKKTIDELEGEKTELKTKLGVSENNIRIAAKEKSDLMKKIEQHIVHLGEIKKNVQIFMLSKLGTFRSDLRDLKTYFQTTISNLAREQEYKFADIQSQYRMAMDRRLARFEDEKLNVQTRLKSEFQHDLDNLTEKYERLQKEIAASHEQRLQEKERRIEQLMEEIDVFNRKMNQTEREVDRLNHALTQSQEEHANTRAQLAAVTREKDNLSLKLAQTEKKFIEEIQELTEEMKRTQLNTDREKEDLQLRHQQEIVELHEQIETFKNRHLEVLKRYDDEIRELVKTHTYEIDTVKRNYEDALSQLRRVVANAERNEQDLHERIAKFQEKINQLEKQIYDAEIEKNTMRASYEHRLEEFESKMEEVNFALQREHKKIEDYRAEKNQEVSHYKSTVQVLQEEIRIKSERINNLLAERVRFEQHIRDLQAQLDKKTLEMDRQRQEILDKTMNQTKEIEHLHNLLSKSYRGVNDSGPFVKEESTQDFSKSIDDLKKLNQYLEHNKSPRLSVTDKTPYRDRSPYTATFNYPSNDQEYDTFRTKKLSLSQLKS